ncbi:nitrogenase iron-molybdenum cofactor biosynthesis protein NifN [Sulfuriferula nivalis]|uniref:Nitrogenase iron-molybdenum cofactor biosynthesis protein NifN n=1 Tax=Sulfuriferula nivalis TaxID=2675298 RepID=A0A809RDI5_9PROT|nr:nitrogenase iron-molybdenum cofactor biosynthesis protein NifN [Sulfuriferula nivalis]BBO99705.1 nitrogenase iron-molybdenum cofactor biosynthesis protein NifN [Sulfuriferula nivalis]
MANVVESKKSCTVNPLKMSQPLGASYAYMGMNNCMPMMHGSQGCTAFGLVLMVRHFREAIPLQTTAMNEATTILGGMDNIEKAIVNIKTRAKPDLIGICSTGLTETKGEDVAGDLKLIRAKHPELGATEVVYVSTPDYVGAFQDGWAKAVQAMIVALAVPATERNDKQINVLAGCHLTPGDIEELREIIESFGLSAIVMPDLSGSLDGHIPEEFSPSTLGGTTLAEVRSMGASAFTIAIGEQMRASAEALESITGVGFELFDRLTGLEPNDRLLKTLSRISGLPIPMKFRRQRSQLLDAMLDGHFYFGGKKVAIGAEPDLLWATASWLAEMGCELTVLVTTTKSPILSQLPVEEVLIGDLEDLELRAKGCDMLITHSHGRQAAERLDIPFFRMGIPMFDRLGGAHRLSIGYRGTRGLVFELSNMFLAAKRENHPDSWPLPAAEPAKAVVPVAGSAEPVAELVH